MQQIPRTQLNFKICLIGDGGVGKTTYINRVLDGPFQKEYHATQGAVVHKNTMWTDRGDRIVYDVWDTAGQERKAGLKDLYYLGADGAIFFYDVTSRVSANNLPVWINNFKKAAGYDKPIIVVANKIDVADRKVNKKNILNLIKQYEYEYCEVSAKTTTNFVQPFLLMTRKLTNDPGLIITSNVNLAPTKVNYDVEADYSEINAEYDFARNADIEE